MCCLNTPLALHVLALGEVVLQGLRLLHRHLDLERDLVALALGGG